VGFSRFIGRTIGCGRNLLRVGFGGIDAWAKPRELAGPMSQLLIQIKPREFLGCEDMVSGFNLIRPIHAANSDPDALGDFLSFSEVLKGELTTAASAKSTHGKVRRLEMLRLALGVGKVLRRKLGIGDKRSTTEPAAHTAVAMGDRLRVTNNCPVADLAT
tara:strand:+ start:65 stop:544 length:480 start_codon:yes stop_codon:yes gene_type:complete